MRWIKTFYKHIQSCVINNGLSSDYFYLTRGVRQGDPLSPYLFLLAVETLAIAVRENSNIKGITIEDEETKIFNMQTIRPLFSQTQIQLMHSLSFWMNLGICPV